MENRKFNIGDKVVLLELQYFDNPYHFSRCIKELTVKDATDNHFSIYSKLDPYFSGINQYDIRHQYCGLPMYGDEKVYHKEKDKDEISLLINKAISEYDDFTNKSDKDRIHELQDLIKRSKESIEEIKKGNGSWKLGFSTYNNQEYKTKVIESILKIFDFKIITK